MSIALSDDHRSLAGTVRDFLARHGAVTAARELLEAAEEPLPSFWSELAGLGWLGLHLPERFGGSGYGIPEVLVVVEQLGREVCPGPAVPTMIAGAVIDAAAPDELKARYLPGLADGSTTAGVGLVGHLQVADGRASGTVGAVLGGGMARLLLVPSGDDALLIEADASGVTLETPKNLDPTRRSARLTLADTPVGVITGGRRALVDLARLILAAEATGVAHKCTESASEYAKLRVQFGRPIGTYQAVKHHCANMLVEAESATAATWDAGRAAAAGGDTASLGAAMAASLAAHAAVFDANLNIQVHGGIGYTWEHDAHLYLRRATAIASLIGGDDAPAEVAALTRAGVRRRSDMELPPEAEEFRREVAAFAESLKGLDSTSRRRAMLEAGYAMPHWPRPWGRDAGAVEQLVIEQEFARAGIHRPAYGITGWVILTLIQHATEDQIARWVRPALDQEVIWCQLFSEPDAGSDAAGIKTRGRRVEGGWVVNGQKVWTSGAHLAGHGLATVRTDPDAPKHKGITMMVIDMHAEGVSVRPLRQVTGDSEFNEVFFNDVFIPDDDVVGPVDGGWAVARATLGNESVSIGGGGGGMALPVDLLFEPLEAHPDRLPGGTARVGRHIARTEAIGILNLRSAYRAVSGGEPGPEGNMTKLLLSELGHEAAAILQALAGPDAAYLEGAGALAGMQVLRHRALSIAGGTSEIKRNQIGERLLGLPRDPLIK